MSIGEFSRASRLSVKSLRHYDTQGLLKPAEVDPSSGYRYYSSDQLINALVIALLRSVDVPLAEIAEVLHELPSAGTDVLKRHRARLEARIEHDSKLLDHVERLIAKGGPMSYEIKVKEIPTLDGAAIRVETTPEAIGPDLDRAYAALFRYLSENELSPADVPVAFYRSWEPNNWVVEACVPVNTPVAEEGEIHALHIPGGEAAFLTHVGPYEELGLAHRAMGKWFEEHGHEMSCCYERYMNDPHEEADPARYETEVVWPLVKT